MKQSFSEVKNMFFGEGIDFRLKIFNFIAIAEIFINTIIIFIFTILQITHIHVWFTTISINIVFSLAIYILIKNKKYKISYIIDILSVFANLFLLTFLVGDRLLGIIPLLFVISIMLIIYIFDNTHKMYLIFLVQTITYILISFFTYLFIKTFLKSQKKELILINIIVGLIIISIVYSFIMYVQFNLYNKNLKKFQNEKENSNNENKAKSILLASISHEIRTPLNIITGTNDLIQRDTSSEHIKQLSLRISNALLSLNQMISNILDISKIEFGNKENILETYSTDELISSFEIVGSQFMKESEIKFHMKVSENIPKYLIGDMLSIKKIVINFLSNAFKYTNEGYVLLYINYHKTDNDKQIILSIEVSDTGIGIKQEYLSNIFDIFNRADVSNYKNIEGTGLGLAIVKELADSIGAKISVDSIFNVGSTFKIEVLQDIAIVEENKKEIHNSNVFYAPNVRILAVDDNNYNLLILKEMLEPTQIKLDTVLSGKACLEYTLKNDYHIILMDFIMPDMNGLELIKKLKQQQSFNTPVIALTANAISGTENLLLSGGFSNYLSKPFTISNLYKILIPYIPKDLISYSTNDKNDFINYKANNQILKFTLLEFGLDLDIALKYFDNDILKLRKIAILLSQNYQKEKSDIKKSIKLNSDNLKYQAHSLKSRTKNVGLIRLSNIAAEIETLCINNNFDEAKTMIPHLLYLWDLGQKALELLIQNTNDISDTVYKIQDNTINIDKDICNKIYLDIDKNTNLDFLYDELILSLKNMNRKPSLNLIDTLIKKEEDENNINCLKNSILCVLAFDFKKAQYIIENLCKPKEKRD